MQIAVLADIHGNLPALQAVVAELERLQPDYVAVNGDLINAVPFSAEVVDLVRQTDWVVVRGNHEFYYLDYGTPREAPGSNDPVRWGQLHWLMERITPAQGAYLGMLPDVRIFDIPGTQPLCMTHGTPGHNRMGFYMEQAAEVIAHELMEVKQHTLISAHTHVQVDRQITALMDAEHDPLADPNGGLFPHEPEIEHYWHLVNPGSVGLPLNGDTRAQFAIIENKPESVVRGGWQATHHRVAYDHRAALDAFHTTGMLEAGGAISQLFYWQLVTGESEIIFFYRWARAQGFDPDGDTDSVFAAYRTETARAAYVRQRDPRYQPQASSR